MSFGSARILAAAVGCAVVVSAASVAARADEDAARVAFDDALDLVEQARNTPSPAERWTLYETAYSYMSQIKKVFPGSAQAHRLRRDESVDGTKFAYVKRELLKAGRAVCDQDFSATCVLRLALDVVQIAAPPHPGDIYLEIVQAQAAAGDIAGAFTTLEVASSRDLSAAIPAIMAAMVRAADLDGALAKATGFRRARDRDIALLTIVRTLGKKGDVANGRIAAARIGDAGDRARALATVAAAGRRGDGSTALFDEAFDLARTVADPEARAKLLFEMAELQLAADRTAQAREAFEAAVAAARTVGGAEARAKLLFKIAKVQLAADHTAEARATLEAALAATRAMPEPRERRYTLYYLKQYSKETFSAAARAITEEFQEKAARIDVDRDPIGLVFDDAEARIDSGDFGGAEALLERAHKMAHELIDETSRDHVYGQIVTNRLKMGDFDGALRVWALMRGPYAPSSALREIGTAQAKAGDIEGLRRLMALVEPDSRGLFIGWSIVPQLAKSGRLAEAHNFASQVVNDSYYLNKGMIEIAKGEAVAGEFDAAVETALSMRGVSYRAEALVAVAAEQFRRGRAGAAKAILRDAFHGMFGVAGILRDVEGQIYKPVWEAFKNIGAQLARIEASTVANVP